MSLPDPSPLWQWHFDPQENWLCLSLDSLGAMKTGLQKKSLRDKHFQFEAFSVSDSQYYVEVLEHLEITPVFDYARFAFVVAINAVAVGQYHKEVAAKNWYFQEAFEIPLTGRYCLASVKTESGQADVMLLDGSDEFWNCLLLQPLRVNQQKVLADFSLIKVSDTRLFPFTGKSVEEFEQ